MTDQILVNKFVEKNFDVIIGNKNLEIFDKFNNSPINETNFRNIIYTVFDDYWVKNDDHRPMELTIKWYKEKEKNLIEDIINYLDGCSVTLGPMNWVLLDENKAEISDDNFCRRFYPKYSKSFTSKYLSHWLDDKIFDESQKIMENF